MKLFSLFDIVAENYTPIMLYRTVGECLREIADQSRKKGSKLHELAADLKVFELGEFSQVTGELKPLPVKICHGTVLDIRSLVAAPVISDENVTPINQGVTA